MSVLAFLLGASSPGFASIVVEPVSKARAKELGATISAKMVGTNQVEARLELPRAGKFQTITSVTLEITSNGRSLVSAPLSPLKQTPDSVVFCFSTEPAYLGPSKPDPAYLGTSTLTVMYKSSGFPPYDGFRFNIGDLVTRDAMPPFQKVHVGMSRQEVYRLLGEPEAVVAQGVKGVNTEVWVAPPDSHGQRVRLSVLFWGDGNAHQVEQDILK